MPQYALLIQGTNVTEVGPEFMQRFAGWARSIAQSGKLGDTLKLKDGEGHEVTRKQGEIHDGPFTETKETISGLFVIEASDYQEAARIARECPTVTEGVGKLEIRQIIPCGPA